MTFDIRKMKPLTNPIKRIKVQLVEAEADVAQVVITVEEGGKMPTAILFCGDVFMQDGSVYRKVRVFRADSPIRAEDRI